MRFLRKKAWRILLLAVAMLGWGSVTALAQDLQLPAGPGPELLLEKEELVAAGVQHRMYRGLLPNGKPLVVHVIEADLHNPEVEVRPVAAAEGRYGKRESVASLAARSGGVAAVNGGYFSTAAPYLPVGNLIIDGEILAASDIFRTSLGWLENRSAKFGYFKPEISLVLPGGSRIPVERVNQNNAGKGLVLFTEAWGSLAGSGRELEVLVSLAPLEDGSYQVVDRSLGNVSIPVGGLALRLDPEGPGFDQLQIGSLVRLERTWDPYWDGLRHLLTSGPLLVEGGRPVFQHALEGFSGSLEGRHPRTAIGLTGDGKMLLVTVDGRQPGRSEGVTFEELSYLMIALGADAAMGLDGGGSTTCWVNGRVANQPSDGSQRLVANGIVVKSGIVVFLDGNRVYFDVPPLLEKGRTLVPLRAIFEALGAEVGWDEASRTVTAVKPEVSLSLQIDSTRALVNDREMTLDVPARVVEGRTLVPLRFVGEALGASVDWDPKKIIHIYTRQ
ncbi:MAG: copper amine oxidase [Clostridia bacterium]|nr:copper amine oxidase [Clostridia bacterium]